MDPITIASLIAMIAGAGVQYKAQSDAAKRAKEQTMLSQQRQLQAQNEATQAAAKRASDFDPTARAQSQQQIEQDLTQTYEKQATQPQITAQGVQVGSTIPDAQGSSDYLTAKAKEQAKSTASLRALAAMMGRIGAAGEQRRREAVAIGDTAGDIGRIQTGANNMAGIDQVGIEAAAQPSAGLTFAGELLRAGGGAGFAYGSKPTPKTNVNAGSAWA